ncbi:MAG: hypothetical protein K0S68_375 [Candidatus Saccharibacteria bacterium]|jgi:GNAT superfamily N-acetyltransferase|nr:hypothetical protein [Candidatus Saccharibacteria bacterium]
MTTVSSASTTLSGLDLLQIARLLNTKASISQRAIDTLQDREDTFIRIIRDPDGRIVGIAQLVIVRSLTSNIAEVTDFFTDPGRSDVQDALLADLIERARQAGANRLELRYRNSDRIHRYLRRRGLATGSERVYKHTL